MQPPRFLILARVHAALRGDGSDAVALRARIVYNDGVFSRVSSKSYQRVWICMWLGLDAVGQVAAFITGWFIRSRTRLIEAGLAQ